MNKIIINADDNIEHSDAVAYVLKVINQGLISENETQYCWVTTFETGYKVYSDKTKTGTFTFRVWKGEGK